MSQRAQYQNEIPQYVGENGDIVSGELQEGEDEVMEEGIDEQGYASSTPTSSSTWISWFCSLPGHEYFCEVTEDFIEDDFNLTGLNSLVPFWKEAMEIVLDVEPEDALRIPDMSIVESSAELLYGLVHQRYILTRPGLQSMVEKYEAGHFGACPRVFCKGSHVAPCGRSDLPGLDTVKLYCPNCNDIYSPPSSRYQSVDGAFFGTTFAPLLFQTYREIAPAPFCPPLTLTLNNTPKATDSPRSSVGSPADFIPQQQQAEFVNPHPHGGKKRPAGGVYEAKLFGFRVSERARSGPRMRWLRMRPETLDELDNVDWRGQWKTDLDGDEEFDDEDDADGDDEDDDGNRGRMENFDDDFPGEEDEEEEEEEEDGGGGAAANGRSGRSAPPSIPHPPAAPSGRLGRGKMRVINPLPDDSDCESEASTRRAIPTSRQVMSDSDPWTSEISTPDDDDDLPPRPPLAPRTSFKAIPVSVATIASPSDEGLVSSLRILV